MDKTKKYYDEEMRYLEKEGARFAEAFPESAARLHLNSPGDRDPDVERLLEGFAFLTGRIREQLDDDFSDVAANMLEHTAPEFLRQVPSLAMLQFQPRPGMLHKSYTIPRHTVVLSNPTGKELRTCRFQTTREVTVHPLSLVHAGKTHHSEKGTGIVLTFLCEAESGNALFETDLLPLFIHAERSISWRLHYLLNRMVKEVEIQTETSDIPLTGKARPAFFGAGYSESERLFPNTPNSPENSRLLHEFFSFEEKFRFLEMKGWCHLRGKLVKNKISLCFYFSDAAASLLENTPVQTDMFKLYTTPVINVYESQAEPVRHDHSRFEYPVIAKAGYPDEVYAIKEVKSINPQSGKEINYRKMYAPGSRVPAEKNSDTYYTVRREHIKDSGYQSFVSLNGGHPEEELISFGIYTTNADFPRENINEGDICNPVSGFPDFIRFENITRPTATCYPPKPSGYLWSLIAHFRMNLKTLCQKENFCNVLQLYDWAHSNSVKRINQKLTGLSLASDTFFLKGQLLRGARISITLQDNAFEDAGELNVLGEVLHRFFSGYASINCAIALDIKLEPSGDLHSWLPEENG
ncbi:MAG: type VI secretion system baseplate subunit TssF [Fibrobacteria bacterium]|nr:type VI secretion system baseplate subunit TssF [Fibrobacteria bacterium]